MLHMCPLHHADFHPPWTFGSCSPHTCPPSTLLFLPRADGLADAVPTFSSSYQRDLAAKVAAAAAEAVAEEYIYFFFSKMVP